METEAPLKALPLSSFTVPLITACALTPAAQVRKKMRIGIDLRFTKNLVI
jgi:hypothetical protein